MPGLTTEPKTGWDVTVEKIRSATASPAPDGDAADDRSADPISSVTRTASTSDAAIAPGRFELFRISVGPLPSDVDVLLFEAMQTYTDGDVVSWDGRPANSADDPASATPAPVQTLTAPAPGDRAKRSPLPAATAAPGASAAPVASPEPTRRRPCWRRRGSRPRSWTPTTGPPGWLSGARRAAC